MNTQTAQLTQAELSFYTYFPIGIPDRMKNIVLLQWRTLLEYCDKRTSTPAPTLTVLGNSRPIFEMCQKYGLGYLEAGDGTITLAEALAHINQSSSTTYFCLLECISLLNINLVNIPKILRDSGNAQSIVTCLGTRLDAESGCITDAIEPTDFHPWIILPTNSFDLRELPHFYLGYGGYTSWFIAEGKRTLHHNVVDATSYAPTGIFYPAPKALRHTGFVERNVRTSITRSFQLGSLIQNADYALNQVGQLIRNS